MFSQDIEKDLKAKLLSMTVTLTSETTATVQSQSDDKIYHINGDECECPDHKFRGNYCKHLKARDLKQLEEQNSIEELQYKHKLAAKKFLKN